MTEEQDDIACRLAYIDELNGILKPTYGDAGFLSYAAKRCAAMAAKLPAAQKKACRLATVIATLRRRLGLVESASNMFRASSGSYYKALCDAAKNLQNWRRKAARIAAALGTRDGETLVESAERVAKQTNYAELIRRAEEAEAHRDTWGAIRSHELEADVAKWKGEYEIACTQRDNLESCRDNAVEEIHKIKRDLANWKARAFAGVDSLTHELEDRLKEEKGARDDAVKEGVAWKARAESLAADFYRPILAALGVSDALTFKGAAEQVLAKLNAAPAAKPRPEPGVGVYTHEITAADMDTDVVTIPKEAKDA